MKHFHDIINESERYGERDIFYECLHCTFGSHTNFICWVVVLHSPKGIEGNEKNF